jgi:hypothetical protein
LRLTSSIGIGIEAMLEEDVKRERERERERERVAAHERGEKWVLGF